MIVKDLVKDLEQGDRGDEVIKNFDKERIKSNRPFPEVMWANRDIGTARQLQAQQAQQSQQLLYEMQVAAWQSKLGGL